MRKIRKLYAPEKTKTKPIRRTFHEIQDSMCSDGYEECIEERVACEKCLFHRANFEQFKQAYKNKEIQITK